MSATKTNKYIETIGRRKTSTARVRVMEGTKLEFKVNNRDIKEYFPTAELEKSALAALNATKENKLNITVVVKGGGIHSQAEAVRHGIARALVVMDEAHKPIVKKAGYLKRDPRMKERRKFGLKKARKAPQWSKR